MSQWLRRNWKLKLISLGLAVGLWYYAVNEESVEIVRTIPLSVSIENKNISILKVSSEKLRITIKAPRAMVSQVAGADIRAKHEFGREMKQAGEYSFHTDPREISLPSVEMQVLRIEPQVVRVVVDEVVTQKLPVKPHFVGEPALGYKIRDEELQMDPNAVMVQGPKGQIEKMTAAMTKPISLTGRTRSFRLTTDFDLPTHAVVLDVDAVDVYVPIHEVSDEKELVDVPIKMVRPSGSLGIAELNPQKISIKVQGPSRVLQNLEASQIHAYADLTGLDYGEHLADVFWVFPQGVSLKEEKRVQIQAILRREASKK
ncbi:MAG TPA: hypothetical protein DIS66_01790 [Candidatus Omnitrophica bacterium]|nr:hypothetical protein [Candidatus Omnitrophota bacterium]